MAAIDEFCGLDRTYGYLAIEFLSHDSRPTLMLGLSEARPPNLTDYKVLFTNDAFLQQSELNSPEMYSMFANMVGCCTRVGDWITRISPVNGPSGGVAVITATKIGAELCKIQMPEPKHIAGDLVGVWGKVSPKPAETVGDTETESIGDDVQPAPAGTLNDLKSPEDDVRRPYRPSLDEFGISEGRFANRNDSTSQPRGFESKTGHQQPSEPALSSPSFFQATGSRAKTKSTDRGERTAIQTSEAQSSAMRRQRKPIIDWRIPSKVYDTLHFQNLRSVDWWVQPNNYWYVNLMIA
jgi:hypothetical protein